VPNLLFNTTIKNALLFGAGRAAGAGALAGPAATLAEGALKTMLGSKCKMAVLAMLAVGLGTLGVAGLSFRAPGQENAGAGGADRSPGPVQKDQKPDAGTKASAPKAPAKANKELAISGQVLDMGKKPVAKAEVAVVAMRNPDASGKKGYR